MPRHHWVRVQANGQITTPKDIRQSLGLHKGNLFIFEEVTEEILLTPLHVLAANEPEPACAFIQEHGLSLDDSTECVEG